MNPLDAILSILATWRAATIISEESGPGKMFVKLRTMPELPQNVRDGLQCPLCLSVWASALCVLILCSVRRMPWKLAGIAWLGISGGSALLTKVTKK